VNVELIEEHGELSALLGLSLSYNQDPARMASIAGKLCLKGDGHNKFLESVVVWLDIDAPRYFWQQFDTYRVGVSKQSESTMHTMTVRPLRQEDFESPIPQAYLSQLNRWVENKDWRAVKRNLPESFLQRRIVCLNYMTLQRMIRQRSSHRLVEWRAFIDAVLRQVKHPEWLGEGSCA
jgi:thymidylate synthase ThyX